MDERELEAFRQAYRHLQASSAATSPTDEELADLVAGTLTDEDRDRIAMRMLHSPKAIEKHQIMAALHQPRTQRSYRPLALPMTAAASLALVSTLVFALGDSPRPPEGHAPTRSSDTTTSPPSGAKLESAPASLGWVAPSHTFEYRVKLRNAAAVVIWESAATLEAQVTLPGDVRKKISKGTFLWTVEGEAHGHAFQLGPYFFDVKSPETP